ncbi:MAG: hypothetical protein ACODAJ_16170 [Planctomycetota bacterium]
MRIHRPDRLRRSAAAAVILGLLALPAAARTGRQQALVPANFQSKTDALGFRWDLSSDGSMRDHQHNAFNQLARLYVNGNNFSSSRQLMTPNGEEYVLTQRMGSVQVTRRVRVDTPLGICRYVESFRNLGSGPAPVSVMLRTYLGSNCQSVVTNRGTANPSSLGKKECGFIAVQQGGHRPSVLFFLGTPRSQIRPSIMNNNNYDFRITYSTVVPPGKTVALCHAYGQRRFHAATDPKALAKLFKPLQGRKWLRDLPRDARRAIVNLRGFGYLAEVAPELHTLKSLGIEPAHTDVLAFRERTRLQGKAACDKLAVTTRYGKKELAFERVAALVGGARLGRGGQVFLRDGRVLSGTLDARGLRFAMNSGLTMDLQPETVDRLVLQAQPDDGKPAPDVTVFIETFEGHRLAVRQPGGKAARFTLRTPWGRIEVPAGDIRWARLPEGGQPGHLVALKDGSRFFAFLDGPPVELHTLTFARQKVRPADIRTVSAAGEDAQPDEEPEEITQPHVVLSGGSILVGRVALPKLHLLSAGEVIPVPPSQVRTLHNLAEDQGVPADRSAMFEAELWGGGTAVGRLRELLLPVRVGGRVLKVPVRDVVDVKVPTPTVPEALRQKIAGLIRDLGHADWEARQAASRQLGKLGFMAKAQLTEASKHSTDAEIRRRARLLLEGMKE